MCTRKESRMADGAPARAEPDQAEEPGGERLYPNCDSSVWLRSCEEEMPEPVDAVVSGSVPPWLRGSLLRNGPGSLQVGDMKFQHLFDSSALLHRFAVSSGRVTYQCRFLRSRTYCKNQAARRIVVTEFGTRAVPDPCKTIFDRVSALFHPDEEMSDNAMISLYPFGDEIYAFTESPVIHRIDPVTLSTCGPRSMSKAAALINHTSHPHIMPNGDVYNLGMTMKGGRIRHVIVKFPHSDNGDMFERAEIVASMKPRWPLHPSYMHTFGVTQQYWVVVEQPLSVSLGRLLRAQLAARPLRACLTWRPHRETHIVLLSREDGRECRRFRTTPLFYLHIINCYEEEGQVVVDLCSYKDAKVIDAMYVHAMENMQSNPDYAEWFRARPRRLRLPLGGAGGGEVAGGGRGEGKGGRRRRSKSLLRVEPELLADVGCETPTLHTVRCDGRPYRYFYAISSDVDAENPGTLIKVDTVSGEVHRWCEPDCYPSEPVFVPRPGGIAEDDGVALSALVWASKPHQVGLLILDASTWTELARAVVDTPSDAPKCLHGWFLPDKSI